MKINRSKVIGTLLIAGIILTGCGSQKKEDSTVPPQSQETTETPAAADDTAKTPDTNKAENTYTPGTLTADYYESEWLNLRFTPPESVTLVTKGQMDISMSEGSELLKENLDEDIVDQAAQSSVYEMMAVQEGGYPNVSVAVEDVSDAAIDETMYLNILKQNLDTAQLGYAYEDIAEREIAGQAYTAMDASASDNGVDILQTFYLRKIEDKFVVIILSFTNDSKDQADILLKAFTAID